MFHDILFFLLGLVLILGGANYLTDGASAVARRFKMSELVIGMTVVAFGSSTPDFVISLTSTLQGKASLAVGDILGANIFDILFVIGMCALVRPVVIGKATLQKEFPMVVLASAVFFLLSCDMLIDHSPINFIDRSDGMILLCFFGINCYVTYMISKEPETPSTSAGNSQPVKTQKMWLSIVMIAGGLGSLVVGGNWFVDGASGLARHFGMSEAMVGLTIAAIGSSLPDLVTSLIAAIKGHTGLAIGNVVGACVINVFFIIGVCATVHPMDLGTLNAIDFGVLLGGSLLLLLFGWIWGKRTINRPEGAILTLCYVGYLLYLILSHK